MRYWLITRLLGLSARIFYRLHSVKGAIPEDGACIIVANHANAIVDAILVAICTKRRIRFVAKEPIFRMPGLGSIARAINALPVYRRVDGADTSKNQNMFQAVDEALRDGECICIFPEGTSHDEPFLLPIKTGAARMALSALHGMNEKIPFHFVPVGLYYSKKTNFRSEAHITIGDPVDVRTLPSEQDPVKEISIRIRDALETVLFHAKSAEELPILWLITEVISQHFDSSPFDANTSVARENQRMRLEQPEVHAEIFEQATELKDSLDTHSLSLTHLDERYPTYRILGFFLRHSFALLFGFPVAILGVVLFGGPYLLLTLVPKSLDEAEDMRASFRLLGGVVLFPLWTLTLGIVVYLISKSPILFFSVLVLSPCVGIFAHYFLGRRRRMIRDARAFLTLLFSKNAHQTCTDNRNRLLLSLRRLNAIKERE